MLATLLQAGMEATILVVVLVVVGLASPLMLLAVPILLLLALFGFGVGLLFGLANVYYRDVGYLVGIGLNLLFYATPIIYPFEIVPEKVGPFPAQTLITLNPLTQFVGAIRDVTYLQVVPSAARIAGIVLATVVSLVVGWSVFNRYAPDMSEEL